jgi:hypothetical protein
MRIARSTNVFPALKNLQAVPIYGCFANSNSATDAHYGSDFRMSARLVWCGSFIPI